MLTLDPTALDEVLESIAKVGPATGTPERADEVVVGLRDQLAEGAGRGWSPGEGGPAHPGAVRCR